MFLKRKLNIMKYIGLDIRYNDAMCDCKIIHSECFSSTFYCLFRNVNCFTNQG